MRRSIPLLCVFVKYKAKPFSRVDLQENSPSSTLKAHLNKDVSRYSWVFGTQLAQKANQCNLSLLGFSYVCMRVIFSCHSLL